MDGLEETIARAMHAAWCPDADRHSWSTDEWAAAEPIARAIREHLGNLALRSDVRTAAAKAAYESQWGISWNKRAEKGESSAHRTADAAIAAFISQLQRKGDDQ